MSERDSTSRPVPGPLFLALLFAVGFVLGQTGIPVEDGGEIITVARLGGTMHPPGMPLLALLFRVSWFLGEAGPVALMAACAASSLWLLFRKAGYAGLFMSIAVLTMPVFRERILAWDAYGPLFLLFSIAISTKRTTSLQAGYLAGLAAAIHPAGILIPAMIRLERFKPLQMLAGFLLGAGLYLALPVMSAAGCVVDWGSPGSFPRFLRQISAAGYREVYGSSMGRLDEGVLLRHLASLGRMLWPVLLVPVSIGTAILARVRPDRLKKLLFLLALDILFVLLVNPMASGTSQTAWISLLVFCVISAAALYRLPMLISLLIAAAIAVSSLLSRMEPLPDQTVEVTFLMASAPVESGVFFSDNDLLYGCWMEKYGRDTRPDMVLLSTGNFSPWFERLARRYNPDLDTSGGLDEAGGPGTPREVVVARLVQMTVENNPRIRFLTDL